MNNGVDVGITCVNMVEGIIASTMGEGRGMSTGRTNNRRKAEKRPVMTSRRARGRRDVNVIMETEDDGGSCEH